MRVTTKQTNRNEELEAEVRTVTGEGARSYADLVTLLEVPLLDVEWASAIGLGLFIAFWGGIGFGAMIGGVVHADRLERLAAAERSHDRG